MYEFYNPHPQQKLVEDCVKRALTRASGKTYQEVSNELNRIKRAQGAKKYNSNSVWREYVKKNLGATELSFPAEKGKSRMNGARFCEEYPEGTYILRMAGHLSCCVDGVIYDTWDCSEKCVYTAFKVVKLEVNGIYHAEDVIEEDHSEVAASKPMSGICFKGEDIIKTMAKLTGKEILYTKKNEPWIDLNDQESYAKVLDALLHNLEYKYLRWKTRKGSHKTTIYDEHTGMTLIFKNGDAPYLWCIKN